MSAYAPDAHSPTHVFTGSADFFMYQFKILPCTVPHSHDWSSCPFVHRNEKARRRNPNLYSYAAIPCPIDRKGTKCPRGDTCPYSHNVYEYWLHPDRFRTQMCRDGSNCTRLLCFFAHSRSELREIAGRAPADHLQPQQHQQQQHPGQPGMAADPGGDQVPGGLVQHFQQLAVQPQQHPGTFLQVQQQPLLQQQQQQPQCIPLQPGMVLPAGAGSPLQQLAPAAGMGGQPYLTTADAPVPGSWPMWAAGGQQQQPPQQQLVMVQGYSNPMPISMWPQAAPVVGLASPLRDVHQQQQQQQQRGPVAVYQLVGQLPQQPQQQPAATAPAAAMGAGAAGVAGPSVHVARLSSGVADSSVQAGSTLSFVVAQPGSNIGSPAAGAAASSAFSAALAASQAAAMGGTGSSSAFALLPPGVVLEGQPEYAANPLTQIGEVGGSSTGLTALTLLPGTGVAGQQPLTSVAAVVSGALGLPSELVTGAWSASAAPVYLSAEPGAHGF